MTVKTFTITSIEAAYIVAALAIALDTLGPKLRERDTTIMNALVDRLAAPLDLTDDTLARLNRARGQS